MSHLFPPERSLLLPQFETYRLRSLDPDTDLATFPLPGPGATQSRMGYGQQHLSFKEVRGRIGWDHLAVGEGGRGIYVDKEWNVVGFVIQDDLSPAFSTLASLPSPVSSTDQQAEFPSVIPLTPTHWAISTGSGSIYILRTTPPNETFSGSLISRYDIGAGEPSPCLLRTGHLVGPGNARLLLTRSVPAQAQGAGITAVQATRFELLEVSVDPARENGVDAGPERLQPSWVLKGGDLPVWTAWNGEGWVVLSEEAYDTPDQEGESVESEADVKKREREAKVAKLGLGASLPPSESAEASGSGSRAEPMEVDEEQKVYPYSWTQTSDNINVTIPLSASATRNDIAIAITTSTFTFKLSPSSVPPTPELGYFLNKSTRQWWAPVDAFSSTWTFDESKRVVELDIQKVPEGENTRWPSLFSPSEDDDEDDEDDEVPETLSASILASVRESFNNIKTRGPDEPDLPHPALPALLREEMDFDLDDGEQFGNTEGGFPELSGGTKVGRDVFVGYVRSGTATEAEGRASWSKTTACVVSVPLNGSRSPHASVMLKHAVDGLLFEPPAEEGKDPSRVPWAHAATTPALAFVLSSKRDLRLVRHFTTSSGSSMQATVLAFDSGSSPTGQGNVYVYYPPTSKTSAQQGVLGVSGREKGMMLGVGCVQVGGKDVVVGLCENELVVMKGVL
ncbi:hypothetical protein IAT38_004267 [Cryptococcus sp. DSM 104549]